VAINKIHGFGAELWPRYVTRRTRVVEHDEYERALPGVAIRGEALALELMRGVFAGEVYARSAARSDGLARYAD